VEPDVIQQRIDIVLQAPHAGNVGRYHFTVVTDAAKRAGIADYYRRAVAEALVPQRDAYGPRLFASAVSLAEHLHEVPVHIIPRIEGRVEQASPFAQATRYGSILPATWSLMLALRARGVGAARTTLHLRYEQKVAQLPGIPEQTTQAALLPVAYFTGTDFKLGGSASPRGSGPPARRATPSLRPGCCAGSAPKCCRRCSWGKGYSAT
jgi:nitroreductase